MKCGKILLILGILFVFTTSVNSQSTVCGNANDDPGGDINVGDMIIIVDHIAISGAPLPNPPLADLDNRNGIAMADVCWIANYLFNTNWQNFPFDCNPSLNYNFMQSTEDTIFIPYVPAIGTATDAITLPLSAHFSSQTIGYYLPILYEGIGSSGTFEPGTIINGDATQFVFHGDDADSGMFAGCFVTDFTNPAQIATIEYNRTAAGSGSIYLDPVDRNSLWRFAVIHDNGDMYLPVVKTVEVSGYSLQATPNNPAFTAIYGFPPPDFSYDIDITSDGPAINWSADVSDDWIVVDILNGTTPSVMNVSIDVTDLPAAIYNGTITLYDNDHFFNDPVIIDVSLSLSAPFPSMDANCSGEFNVGDLTYLINYLFGIPTGPPPCNPCTGEFPEPTSK